MLVRIFDNFHNGLLKRTECMEVFFFRKISAENIVMLSEPLKEVGLGKNTSARIIFIFKKW